jgi:signal-transduction protein with cAMP-binding, CBS, and nucleotidyltransferase domain
VFVRGQPPETPLRPIVDVMPPTQETLAELTSFLERYPPFSSLSADTLAALARNAEIEYFPAAAEILAQEGPPSQFLYVVRRGAVELLDDPGGRRSA